MDQPERTLSTIQFERGLEILAELNQPALFQAIDAMEEGVSDGAAIMAILSLLGSAAKGKLLRRLAAVACATADEQDAADDSPAKWVELEKAQARRPFKETLEEAKGFFTGLGISDLASLASYVRENQARKGLPAPDPGQEPPPSEG